MQFNTLLLFTITCVIVIYFTWNFFNQRSIKKNSKHIPDAHYYELKSKYEFLVAIGSLVFAIAVFYGLGTKKDMEQNLKSEFNSQLEPTRKQALTTETKIDSVNKQVKETQGIINGYYSALKEIEGKQRAIDLLTLSSKNKFEGFQKRIDTLSKKNILKRSFYLVDNLQLDFKKMENTESHSLKIAFDTLVTTLADKLPRFHKPPIILPVSNMGFALHVFNVTNDGFEIFVAPEWFDDPKNGIVIARLLITEVE